MAEKKKKEIVDFELPNAEDLDLLKQERVGSAERVAQFNKNFVPTGSAFKDAGIMSGTSRDIKRTREIDALFSKAADRQATTRGQDMEFTSQAGNIEMNQNRNRILEKQGEREFELNQNIFKAAQERYRKYGEPSDILNLGVQAARAGVEFDEYGIELTPEMKKLQESITGVAKPEPLTPLGEQSINYNIVPQPKTRLDMIGDVIKEGTGISHPYNFMLSAIKAGKKTGKKIRSYLTGAPDMSNIRRKVIK